jgi:hypothetical protein
MNPQPQPDDLQRLAAELGLDEPARRELADDLAQADQAFRQADSLRPDPQFIARLRQQVRTQLHRRQHAPRTTNPWHRRLAAVAAVAAIALLATAAWWLTQDNATHPPAARPEPPVAAAIATEELVDLWELALAHPGETRTEVDSLLISETLTLWREMDWNLLELFNKETPDENLTIDLDADNGLGARLV